jgi:hypothetical protein
MSIEIEDYIDPMNRDHMIALLHRNKFGAWPEWIQQRFVKDNVLYSAGWYFRLQEKITNAWIKKYLLTPEYENAIAGRYSKHR